MVLGTERSPETKQIVFRLSQSGKNILARNQEGKLENDHLAKLSAQSLGIPSVAWHLWRRSLRSNRESEDGEEMEVKIENAAPDEETLWVSTAQEYSLPVQHQQAALLVLHAILIHGSLTAAELRLVLPVVGENFIVAALVSAGFIEKDGDQLRCRPLAYPAARSELFAAGFPIDKL